MWSFKKIWFQVHWFVGITAGVVLIAIGLSGSIYAFHEEILDWLNPGTASVPVQNARMLSPPEIAQAMVDAGETRRMDRISVYAKPGQSAQVSFVPEHGQRRGASVFVHPYTGERLPQQHGEAFFEWIERLHRWLLLTRENGKPITGTLAGCLLLLSLSGLYLRWPAKPLLLRTWLTFNTRRKGRSFLWGLHSVAGTWALVVYVMLTLTGMYWAFDAIRAPVDRLAGAPSRSAARAQAQAEQGTENKVLPMAPVQWKPAWAAFTGVADSWEFAQVRLPQKPGQAVQVHWYDASAPHDRARNQLFLDADGSVQRDERFAALPAGRRGLLALYPLHTGAYFGLTGRIIVTLAGLMLPLFAITGWMLYLDRRRKARAARQESRRLAENPATAASAMAITAVVYASQSGHAQRLAAQTVGRLRHAGKPAELVSIAQLDMAALRRFSDVAWIVSTFGDGEPPDDARQFASLLRQAPSDALVGQRFGLLALGDRQYTSFCGFGLELHAQLQRAGAEALFPAVTMDDDDAQAWSDWMQLLAGPWGLKMPQAEALMETDAVSAGPDFEVWTLCRRMHCNPGSQGAPLYRVELQPAQQTAAHWQAGALAEIQPRNATSAVQAWLQSHNLDPQVPVTCRGQRHTLAEALAVSLLPDTVHAGSSAQSIADRLQALHGRRYSVASLPEDRGIELWVRQAIAPAEAGGEPRLGLASGWLTQHAELGASLVLRVLANPGFSPVEEPGLPAIFIGNGSGYAGLRSHLLARMRAGNHDNWFIFGERQQAFDYSVEKEVRAWLAGGQLQRVDFTYSRDAGAEPSLRYVQDVLRQNAATLKEWIARDATLFVCGSHAGMGSDVERALTDILGEDGVQALRARRRYRRDVY